MPCIFCVLRARSLVIYHLLGFTSLQYIKFSNFYFFGAKFNRARSFSNYDHILTAKLAKAREETVFRVTAPVNSGVA